MNTQKQRIDTIMSKKGGGTISTRKILEESFTIYPMARLARLSPTCGGYLETTTGKIVFTVSRQVYVRLQGQHNSNQ